jgi:hypothetical protein
VVQSISVRAKTAAARGVAGAISKAHFRVAKDVFEVVAYQTGIASSTGKRVIKVHVCNANARGGTLQAESALEFPGVYIEGACPG